MPDPLSGADLTPYAYQYLTDDLFQAVEPIAAYCDRTPRPNRHADELAALLEALANFGTAADQVLVRELFRPDWQAIAYRLFARFPYRQPPDPLAARTRAHLATLTARAALPLAKRTALARLNSHYMGRPDSL